KAVCWSRVSLRTPQPFSWAERVAKIWLLSRKSGCFMWELSKAPGSARARRRKRAMDEELGDSNFMLFFLPVCGAPLPPYLAGSLFVSVVYNFYSLQNILNKGFIGKIFIIKELAVWFCSFPTI